MNKVCASGMKAITLGASEIKLGTASIVVAGGMESMSNAPYAVPKARQGLRLGSGEFIDLLQRDGLFDPYGKYLMGVIAEKARTNTISFFILLTFLGRRQRNFKSIVRNKTLMPKRATVVHLKLSKTALSVPKLSLLRFLAARGRSQRS